MKRYDLINALIKKYNYKSYLEIGVRDNHCFNKIKIQDKSGVDPMKDDWEIEKGEKSGWDSSKVPVKYRITSDEYFDNYDENYDIIFIDGLHENEQVYRDINNSLNCLNPGGSIIMHDCLPLKEEHQSMPRTSNYWNGDVWKAFVRVRNERKDVEMCVVDADCGLGFIQWKEKSEPAIKGKVKLDWKNYEKNKEDWMNIKSIDEIVLSIGEENFKKEGEVHKRVQNFLHSGSLGDVIYSLPFIIKKGGGNLYVKNKGEFSATNKQYNSLFRLLAVQPYINKVVFYQDDFGNKKFNEDNTINTDIPVKYDNSIELDFDLDYFRLSPTLHKEHIIFSYFKVWQESPENIPFPYLLLKEDYEFKHPDLKNKIKIPEGEFNVFHITQRYRDGVDFNWEKCIKEQKLPNYYIGLQSEYDALLKDYDVAENLIFYGDAVSDLYDMALIIKKSNKFYCNPSVGQALAIGMNKEYHIAINPKLHLALTHMPIENILNK